MRWNYFVEKCNLTIQESCKKYQYLAMGLMSEVGEVAGKYKKHIRGDGDGSWVSLREKVKLEIGDVLWYIAMLDMYCVYKKEKHIGSPLLSNKVSHLGADPFVSIIQLNQVVSDVVSSGVDSVTTSSIWTLTLGAERVAASFGLSL